MDNHLRGMELSENAGALGTGWEGHEQTLITTIRKDYVVRSVRRSWKQITIVGSITNTAANQ